MTHNLDLIIYQTSDNLHTLDYNYFDSYTVLSSIDKIKKQLSTITKTTLVVNSEYLTYVADVQLLQYIQEIIQLVVDYPIVLLAPYQLACPRLLKSYNLKTGALYTVNNFLLSQLQFTTELYFPAAANLLAQTNDKKISILTLLPAIFYHNMNNINTLQDYHNNDACQCTIVTTMNPEDRPYLLIFLILLLLLIVIVWFYFTWLA